jgi:MFS transporter, MHS family, alpha-ketoglutarate permease
LKKSGHENWFFFYVAGCALISLLVYVFMGESSRRSQLEREADELEAGTPEKVKAHEVLADPA